VNIHKYANVLRVLGARLDEQGAGRVQLVKLERCLALNGRGEMLGDAVIGIL
jgi:hypothetical protein